MPWLVAIALVLAVALFVRGELGILGLPTGQAARLALLLGPSVLLLLANVWLWTVPSRGLGSYAWAWIPLVVWGSVIAAGLWFWPAGDFSWPNRDVQTWPQLAAVGTLAGTLREPTSCARERSTREILLRLVVAGATLLVSASTTNAWSGMWWSHGGLAFAELSARATLDTTGARVTCHATAAVGLGLVILHKARHAGRRSAAFMPVLVLAALAASLLAADLVAYVSAHRVMSAFGRRTLDAHDLEQWALVGDVTAGLGLIVALALLIAGSGAAGARLRSSVRLSGPSTYSLVCIVLGGTMILPGWCPMQVPRDIDDLLESRGVRPLRRPLEFLEGEVAHFTGERGRIGFHTAEGEMLLLEEGDGSLEHRHVGRWHPSPLVEILPDRRATVASLVQAVRRELAGFAWLGIVWRHHDLSGAPSARRRWAFIDLAGRALSARYVELVADPLSCEPPFRMGAATYTACLVRSPGADDAHRVLVLRDAGDLTIDAWLDTFGVEGERVAIGVDRRELALAPVHGAGPSIGPLLRRLGTSEPAITWAVGLALGVLWLGALIVVAPERRGRLLRRLARVLDIERDVGRRAGSDLGPYRVGSFPPQSGSVRLSTALGRIISAVCGAMLRTLGVVGATGLTIAAFVWLTS